MRLSNRSQKLIILGLTLLAFLLRAYRLEAQSYWIEEAWTLYFAKLPLSELWRSLLTEEPKPPFYYFAILYWLRLMGDGEYALRFFSLGFGVMAVPLTYRLGQAMGDRRLGLLAALLMTVAPYQIWHSQEARMYSIFTATSVMSMWGFVEIYQNLTNFSKPGKSRLWRWWLLYVIGTEWAILTHYHALVVVGSQGLFLLLTWRRRWRYYWLWGSALIVIFLIYVPWLVFGSALLQRFLHWLPQPTLWETFERGTQAYTVGEYMPRAEAIPLILVFVAVYLVGLIYAARRNWGTWCGRGMLTFLLAYTLAPNLAAWLYGELRTPVYFERYLIPVQVGYLLTIAIGILAVYDLRFTIGDWRMPTYLGHSTRRINLPLFTQPHPSFQAGFSLSAILLLAVLLSINAYALWQHYFNPAYAKDDWRAVIRKIEAFEMPGDAIIITGDGGEKLFDYYYHGSLPLYRDFLTPAPSPERARQILADIAAKHRRIWFSPYGVDLDPTLEQWLAENTYPAWHSWLGRKRLALYAGNNAPEATRLEQVNTTFTDSPEKELTLVSLAWPNQTTAAGDLLPLMFTWQTATPPERDYQVSLRLINDQGDLFAQSDWPPLAAAGGTSTWSPNQPVTDRRSLWLPADIPPGIYILQLVVYDPASGQALGQPVNISDIPIGPAQITPPLTALAIPNPIQPPVVNGQSSSLKPVGYVLPDKIQPGQEMWLWLYWQAPPGFSAASEKGQVIRLTLSDGTNESTTDFPLVESAGSPELWRPGQVRRAIYHWPTSPRLNGKQGQARVFLLNAAGQVETEAALGQVNLEVRPRRFTPSVIGNATEVTFGQPVRLKLIGYDLPTTTIPPGETLPLTLHWQAETEMDMAYTIFVQLLNPSGQVVAQIDRQPLAGAAPTTTWLPGEIVSDGYKLPLPANLPPDNYRLITGLYNAANGERLPIVGNRDFVELALITVK